MGLDVYLRRCDDKATADAAEQKYNEAENALYEDKTLNDDARRAKRAELAEQFEIVDYHHKSVELIEIDSTKYPDHMFKVGYFRSSYNESGINSVLRDLGVHDLGAIFAPGDEYEFTPNWAAAKTRCVEALTKLRDIAQGPAGKFGVTMVDSLRPECSSNADAMRIFEEHLSRKTEYSYSNSHGLFSATEKPMKVHAIIAGRNKLFSQAIPATYVVYEMENRLDWYIQALEIVEETIDYVLAHQKPETFYMAWSG